jgi:thiol-disulfide isomerase/thioredoxin
MMRHIKLLTVLLAFAVCLPLAHAKRTKLEVGMAAPAWDGLLGVDGKRHAVADLRESKAIAVVFLCNECPVVRSYLPQLNALQKEFGKKGLSIVALNPNKGDAESVKAMKKMATKSKLSFAYLRDDRQVVAKTYGARLTPEVFLLDANRKIVYHGAIDDDRTLKGRPKKKYLSDAIAATLAGKTPDKTHARPFGCAIRWK